MGVALEDRRCAQRGSRGRLRGGEDERHAESLPMRPRAGPLTALVALLGVAQKSIAREGVLEIGRPFRKRDKGKGWGRGGVGVSLKAGGRRRKRAVSPAGQTQTDRQCSHP